MSEEQNVEDYKAALSWEEDSHWERGRIAHEWVQLYANGRSEAAFVQLLENAGAKESQQSVNFHRRVFEAFTNRLVNASWTHHLMALQECDWNADAAKPFLIHAASEDQSVRDMVQSIRESQPTDERSKTLLELCQQLRKTIMNFQKKFPQERVDVLADQLRMLADEFSTPANEDLEEVCANEA